MSENIPMHKAHLVSGFFGGLTSVVLFQPLELLKTRVQQNGNKGVLRTLRELTSVTELWRGTVPSILRTSIGSALYMSLLNLTRTMIATTQAHQRTSVLPKLSMYENLLCGTFSRAVLGVITLPLTVIKSRCESTLYSYKSMSQAISHIYRTEGLRGFMTGLSSTVMRDAPYAGIYVLLYEQAKTQLPNLIYGTTEEGVGAAMLGTYRSTLTNITCAALAAALATTITAPFDIIKTRMQLDPKKYSRFTKTTLLIAKDESIKTFFDGLGLRLARKTLSAGIAWGIYEEMVKVITLRAAN
ncbi:HDL244Wp [Eremothecium sinecaudum]|uniref:Mitochondrial glycine transporter n=1 Tax=Eremothecium sinecaudum TaxID=45286 RepID=A0A0X8HS69_9SACH|nr:HDL244Wp [Eremothecium sinecaudum]AMD20500.1 HDL244Wp [Eremothecium sinecaudum]